MEITKNKNSYTVWNLTRYVTVNTCRHLSRLFGPEVHSLKDKGLGTNLQVVRQLSTWPSVDARVQRKRGNGQLVAIFAHPHCGDFYLSIRRVGGRDSQFFQVHELVLLVWRWIGFCRCAGIRALFHRVPRKVIMRTKTTRGLEIISIDYTLIFHVVINTQPSC
jgi:hypothetical protein